MNRREMLTSALTATAFIAGTHAASGAYIAEKIGDDVFMDECRSLFNGIPDDLPREQFVEYVLRCQHESDLYRKSLEACRITDLHVCQAYINKRSKLQFCEEAVAELTGESFEACQAAIMLAEAHGVVVNTRVGKSHTGRLTDEGLKRLAVFHRLPLEEVMSAVR